MESQSHKCAECDQPVVIEDGEVRRSCDHEDAGIVAEMEAVAYGVGGMES